MQSSVRQTAEAAEDLPQLVLDALADQAVGQTVMLTQPGGARLYTILQATRAPIDRRTATAAITNYLLAERKRQAVDAAVQALRQSAKVEYLGAFASRAASGPK